MIQNAKNPAELICEVFCWKNGYFINMRYNAWMAPTNPASVPRLIGQHSGERYDELRAASLLRLQLNGSFQRIGGQIVDNCQSQARTSDGAARSKEWLKDVGLICIGDSRAKIMDGQEIIITRQCNCDLNKASFSIWISLAFHVGKQIDQDLGEEAAVAAPVPLREIKPIVKFDRDLVTPEIHIDQANRLPQGF